ncbi:MAG TPA: anthrone oxygenase family protein [Acidimicrobiales bacterium]
MIDDTQQVLCIVGAIGAALAAGVLFAFSTFVMSGLRSLPDEQGLAAMQAINKAATTPPFMLVLLGTALLCVGVGISAATRLDERAAVYQLVACALYLVGIVVTIGYHVPRNDALALVNASSSGVGAAWRQYASGWTAWNHVRLLTSLGAAVTFLIALRVD